MRNTVNRTLPFASFLDKEGYPASSEVEKLYRIKIFTEFSFFENVILIKSTS